MPSFSKKSLQQLATCHKDLQTLFHEVIKYFDCTVIEGFRNQELQDKAFAEGKSKLKWPHGKHNAYPSNAVDVAPYIDNRINWNQARQFYYFAGFVMAIMERLFLEGKIKHKIRFGGDWDRDNNVTDETFLDLVHFEIIL
jgi:peptidoglycan L-alanyl-D-glutamate endopeptidase CwlK